MPFQASMHLNLLLPLLEGERCSGLSGALKRLKDSEKLSHAELMARQMERVRALCRHASSTSPFYEARFRQAGVQPEDIRSAADLRAIPVLTREQIRLHGDQIRSQAFPKEELDEAATGGTTDTPVKFYRDRSALRIKMAIDWQLNSWAGYLPGDRVFYLWGARSDYPEKPSWRWRLYDRYLMKREWVATSLFNRESLDAALARWQALRPKVVFAYPTPLSLFCEYLRESRATFHRPKTVICTAESLLDDQRVLITEVLGVQPFEQYGSRDVGMVAGECHLHTGLHFHPLAIHVDHVTVADSELSEMVVTDLNNYGFPLIRYQTNDCSLPSAEPCPCGRAYPLVRKILGRTTDNFILPNGDIVPGISFQNRIINVCPGIKKVQVVQETVSDFVVNYVPTESYRSEDLQLLDARLRTFLGPLVQWRFQDVVDIPRERSGKTRYCVSKVLQNSSRSGHAGIN